MPIDGLLGDEPGVSARSWPDTDVSAVYGVRVATIPEDARGVYDDDRQVIVGWQWQTSNGFRLVASPDGQIISRTEVGLEHPPVDPIDLVMIIGSALRILLRGAARGGARLLEGRLARAVAVRELAEDAAAMLVAKSEATARVPLLFTQTVLNHMADPARFVPVQIIKMAVKYGSRTADPRGVPGLYRYFIPMVRNGKAYGLEVIVRESDQTVMHVLYRAGMSS